MMNTQLLASPSQNILVTNVYLTLYWARKFPNSLHARECLSKTKKTILSKTILLQISSYNFNITLIFKELCSNIFDGTAAR